MKRGLDDRKVRIAVDAMGGDHAPEAVVYGAAAAVNDFPVEVILVGNESEVAPLLREVGQPAGLTIHHASDRISMDAHPARAVRRQKDASIVVAARLVKEGVADGLVGAGNTGASM